MKRGLICFLVLGLASVSWAEDASGDSLGSETQDLSSKIAGSSINFKYLDKNKRGVLKLTNTDNPNFNHLSSSSSSASSGSSSGDFKASAVTSNQTPFRYLYNNQYYQANPYLTYVQIPQAAQIAAQYGFQANPVAHFLQTPTQIQYVATPTVAQIPQIKYQTFGGDYSAAGTSESASSSSATSTYVPQQSSSAQYSQIYSSVPQTQQVASQSFSSGSSAAQSSASSATQTKQVPLYSGYQTQQPVYLQQPYFYVPTPNFIYQQPASSVLLKQQQQIASLYGGQRFGLYNPGQTGQLTYLVPLAVAPGVQGSTTTTTTTTDLKSSGKTAQQSTSSNSFSYGTKA